MITVKGIKQVSEEYNTTPWIVNEFIKLSGLGVRVLAGRRPRFAMMVEGEKYLPELIEEMKTCKSVSQAYKNLIIKGVM